MTTLSLGSDDIVAQSGVTIAAPDASFTPAIETYANQTVTYNELPLKTEYMENGSLFVDLQATTIASKLENTSYLKF